MKRFIYLAIAGLFLWHKPFVSASSAAPLRVGILPNLHFALFYLADAQGFFKKQGLSVVIKEYETGPAAVSDLLKDTVDLAAGAEFVFVLQSFKHPDLRIPATVSSVSNHDLVVRKDRGIARPQDLKGKRVAITRGSSGEFFLHSYLIFHNLQAESIKIVNLAPSEMVKAIAEGTVDAALSWAPHTTDMAKQLGTKVDRWPAQSGQDCYLALFARHSFLTNQAKVVEQLLAALSEAEAFIAKYPDQAQALLRQRFGLDPESFREAWSRSRIQLQLTQDLLVLMEREAKWAVRNKLVENKEVPNYLGFFYFDAMDKVKAEAVSIVH